MGQFQSSGISQTRTSIQPTITDEFQCRPKSVSWRNSPTSQARSRANTKSQVTWGEVVLGTGARVLDCIDCHRRVPGATFLTCPGALADRARPPVQQRGPNGSTSTVLWRTAAYRAVAGRRLHDPTLTDDSQYWTYELKFRWLPGPIIKDKLRVAAAAPGAATLQFDG